MKRCITSFFDLEVLIDALPLGILLVELLFVVRSEHDGADRGDDGEEGAPRADHVQCRHSIFDRDEDVGSHGHLQLEDFLRRNVVGEKVLQVIGFAIVDEVAYVVSCEGAEEIGVDLGLVEREGRDVDGGRFRFRRRVLDDFGDVGCVLDVDVAARKNVRDFADGGAVGLVAVRVVDVGASAVPELEAEEIATTRPAETAEVCLGVGRAAEADRVGPLLGQIEQSRRFCSVFAECDAPESAGEIMRVVDFWNRNAGVDEGVNLVESWVLGDGSLGRSGEETDGGVDDVAADDEKK